MKPIKIIIIQEVFANYREAIFNLLSKDYAIQVIHGKPSKSSIYSVNAPYSKICKTYRFGKFIYLACLRAIINSKPNIVIHQGSPGIISLPLVWFLCKLLRIKFIIWTHGYERTQGFQPEKSFRSRIRLFYYQISDAVVFYTRGRKVFFMKFLDEHKLFYATNTLDSETFGKYQTQLANIGSKSVKLELGWQTKFNLVFIGRMLSEKLPEHLIQAYQLLSNSLKINTSLHFVGDGELFNYLKNKHSGNQNIRFYGAIYEEEVTSKILFAADIMVIPGYLGLSIVHSFLLNTPVISYQQGPDGPFHSPEIEFLKNGVNGILVEAYNISKLAETLEELLKNENLIANMKQNIKLDIQAYSISRMKEGFDRCIKYVLEKK